MPVLARLGARVAPMSFAQERLWLIDAAAPGSATYVVPLFLRWFEPVDPQALRAALTAVVARHEILRTTYELRDGHPVQVVHQPTPVDVEVVEPGGPEHLVPADAERRAREPFDLATGPLLRCVLWRGVPGGDAMLLSVHHIALDGWSLATLFEDLAHAYDAARSGQAPQLVEPDLQYSDFAVWDRETFADPAVQQQLSDRVEELLEVDDVLPLAGAVPGRDRPAPDNRPGRQHVLALPDRVWRQGAELARTLRVTPFVVLFAAFQEVLRRWSRRTEFIVGTVTANRPHADLERMVGFFVNTVPLRCRLDPAWSFAQLCHHARSEAYRSLTYQRIPFDQLTARAAAVRAGGHRLLVDVGFAVQNMPAPKLTAPRWAPPVVLPTGTAKFGLLLIVEQRHDGVACVLEYDSSRYPAAAAERIAEAFVQLLAAAVDEPDQPLSRLAPEHGPLEPVPSPAPPSDDRHQPDAAPGKLTVPQQWAADLFTAALAEVDRAGRAPQPRQLVATSNFFALGGNSMLAVTMLARARRQPGGGPVSLKDFLTEPTVAGLGRLLAARPTATAAASELVTEPATGPASESLAGSATEPGRYPASSAQQRFWFLDRIPALRSAYLVPTVLRLDGDVAIDALTRATDLVLARHPALRSRFALDRKLRQVCYRIDGPPGTTRRTDASGWDTDTWRTHLAEVCWAGFDLATDPPARAELLTARDHVVLVLVVHHIVPDGWSQQLVLAQLAELYRAAIEGRAAVLADPVPPAATLSPTAASTPAAPDDQLARMLDRLAGAPTDVLLPHDRPRPDVQSTLAATSSVSYPADVTAGLRAVTAAEGCSTFMTAAALLAVVLARRGPQRDFLFAFPWAGRERPGSADAVGLFVDTAVLRVDLGGNPTWHEVLRRVRQSCTAAYRDVDVPLDVVAAAMHPDRDLSRPPLTPVYLSAQDTPPDPPTFGPGCSARQLPLDPLHIKYELELTAIDHPQRLDMALSYAVDLFDPATVAGLVTDLVVAAADLVTNPDAHPLGASR